MVKKEVYEVTDKMIEESNIVHIDDLEFELITHVIERKEKAFIVNGMIVVLFFKDGYVWTKGNLLLDRQNINVISDPIELALVEEKNIQDSSFSLTNFAQNVVYKVKAHIE